jgi:hypothetical protein
MLKKGKFGDFFDFFFFFSQTKRNKNEAIAENTKMTLFKGQGLPNISSQ